MQDPPPLEIAQTMTTVTLFLLLHAFSSGTAALTGIEAISNGITAFREPRSRNAAITLIWMSLILGDIVSGHHVSCPVKSTRFRLNRRP